MHHMVHWNGSVKSGICQWTGGYFMLRMLPNAHSFMALSAKPQTLISSGVADCQNKTEPCVL